jgi:hypothetical protein
MAGHSSHPAETDIRTHEHVESSHGSHDDEVRDPAGLDSGLIALVGVAGTILIYVTVLACTATFYAIKDARIAAMQTAPPMDRQEYLAQQDKLLTTTHWINKDQGRVAIPIDQAMEIFVQKGLESGPR